MKQRLLKYNFFFCILCFLLSAFFLDKSYSLDKIQSNTLDFLCPTGAKPILTLSYSDITRLIACGQTDSSYNLEIIVIRKGQVPKSIFKVEHAFEATEESSHHYDISSDEKKKLLSVLEDGYNKTTLKCDDIACSIKENECIIDKKKLRIDPHAVDKALKILAKNKGVCPVDTSFLNLVFANAKAGDPRSNDLLSRVRGMANWDGAVAEELNYSLNDLDTFKSRCNGEIQKFQKVIESPVLNNAFIEEYHFFGLGDPKTVSVVGSSQIPNDKNNTYKPENVIDPNPTRAWCVNTKNKALGEWIELRSEYIEPQCKFKGMAIIPGYAKTQETFVGNGRVKKVKIGGCANKGDKDKAGDNQIEIPIEVSNSIYTATYFTPEEIKLDNLQNTIQYQGKFCIRLEILEVIPGNKSNDVCISNLLPLFKCEW